MSIEDVIDNAFESFMLAVHENGTSGLGLRKALRAYESAKTRQPVGWSYCPECGSEEYQRAYGGSPGERVCSCGQSWWPDVDYASTVQGNLRRLFLATKPERESVAVLRFENGKCSDLDLVQRVGSAITKAIAAKNPAFAGAGVLDSANAVIDAMTNDIEVVGTP